MALFEQHTAGVGQRADRLEKMGCTGAESEAAFDQGSQQEEKDETTAEADQISNLYLFRQHGHVGTTGWQHLQKGVLPGPESRRVWLDLREAWMPEPSL